MLKSESISQTNLKGLKCFKNLQFNDIFKVSRKLPCDAVEFSAGGMGKPQCLW